MPPDSGEQLDRKLKPIWDELAKLRDRQHGFANELQKLAFLDHEYAQCENALNRLAARLDEHHDLDSDEHRKIVVLQVEGKTMGEKIRELVDIEKGRTTKLIAVVGAVTAIVLAGAEILKFFIHK